MRNYIIVLSLASWIISIARSILKVYEGKKTAYLSNSNEIFGAIFSLYSLWSEHKIQTPKFTRSFHILLVLTFFSADIFAIESREKGCKTPNKMVHRKQTVVKFKFFSQSHQKCGVKIGRKKGEQLKWRRNKMSISIERFDTWIGMILFTFFPRNNIFNSIGSERESEGRTFYRCDTHVKCQWGIVQLPLEIL